MKFKEVAKVVSIPVIFASLCCLSPVILVFLGLSTASFAASLSDTLYGTYKWYFRAAGLILLAASLGWYFWKAKGICTIDQVKRRRNEIINTVLLTLVAGIIGYIIFLYVIVEYFGMWLGIWR